METFALSQLIKQALITVPDKTTTNNPCHQNLSRSKQNNIVWGTLNQEHAYKLVTPEYLGACPLQ